MKKNNKNSVGEKFNQLVKIMAQLRGENGCPWDREQTHKSLRQYLLEETFEVLESIDQETWQELKEELGDLLLQIVFHAQIARENKEFTIEEVIDAIIDKLIRRHPHVFGNVEIKTAQEQSIHWEKLKMNEGKSSVLDGVPKALSALLRAERIQQKAASVGFDWPKIEPVWDKIQEEIEELKQASRENNETKIEEEFGDLLFSLVNVSRFLGVNAEDALRLTTEKFIKRFNKLEDILKANNKDIHEVSLDEMDRL
ncbi:MAG: nucleoside triphosphate pyrophosphohydrolase, partial [Calditrichaeota bacterium]